MEKLAICTISAVTLVLELIAYNSSALTHVAVGV